MASLSLSLQMLTGEHAPATGSGWYVSSYNSAHLVVDGKEISPGALFPPTLVSSADAAVIENAFKQGIAPEKIFPLLAVGDDIIKIAIQSELDFAENEAKKIAGLRKRLQTIGTDANSH